MSPDKDGLAPCPFCGGTDMRTFPRTCDMNDPYDPADRAYPMVRCNCGAEVSGENWGNVSTAIAAWNRRDLPNTGDELVAELRALILEYWDEAFDEGAEGRATDTPDGKAQQTWSAISARLDLVASLTARAQAAEASLASAREAALEEAGEALDTLADAADYAAMNAMSESHIITYRRDETTLKAAAAAIRALKEAR